MAALRDDIGEQLELYAGALELALQPCLRQAGLAAAQLVKLGAGGAQHAGGLSQQPHPKLLVSERRGCVGGLSARGRDRLVVGVGVAAQDRARPRVLGGEDGAGHQMFIPDRDLV